MGEYVAYEALIETGLVTRDAVDAMQKEGLSRDTSPFPLIALEQNWTSAGRPYAVAYVAVKALADRGGGPAGLAALCREVASGTPWGRAFPAAAGTALSSFYERFEAARSPSSSGAPTASTVGILDPTPCDGVTQRRDVTCLGRADPPGTNFAYQFRSPIGALASLPKDQLRLIPDCAAVVDFTVIDGTISLFVPKTAPPEICHATLLSTNRSLSFNLPLAFVHR